MKAVGSSSVGMRRGTGTHKISRRLRLTQNVNILYCRKNIKYNNLYNHSLHVYIQFENVRDGLNTWSVDNLPVARQLHKISEQICNLTARRLISLFVNLNLPPVADDTQTNRFLCSIVVARSTLCLKKIPHLNCL